MTPRKNNLSPDPGENPALEIMELCALAGKPLDVAIAYMRKGMTAARVHSELVRQRGGELPLDENLLVKAAIRISEQGESQREGSDREDEPSAPKTVVQ